MRTVHITLLAVGLVLAAGIGCPGAESNPPGIYVEPQSGMVFPEQLGTLKRDTVRKYDKPEMGVGIRYSGPASLKVDVYLYTAGQKDLGTGTAAAGVLPHFKECQGAILQMEKRGDYRSVTKISEKPVSFVTPYGKLPALSACYEYVQSSDVPGGYTGKRVSYLMVTAYHDLFFKIRFTYTETDKVAGEKAMRAFLSDCGKLMRLEATAKKGKAREPVP
jgi:hypothetical protein